MTRAIAAAFILATTALLVPGSAIAQAAPNPNPLWSEFPLQPVVETVPTSSTPAPEPEQPVPASQTVGENDRTAGLLILVGAALAAGAGFLGRRRIWRRQQPQGEVQPEPERAAVHTFKRPVLAGGSRSGNGLVAVATRSRTGVGMPATLIETLSPQARLADELEGAESETELETHEVCEIACWRGYVTWQFYVELDPPQEASLSSPYFRAPGKGAPEQTEPALAAHAVLVEKLVAAGWEPEGYGEEWFSERFQRATPSA